MEEQSKDTFCALPFVSLATDIHGRVRTCGIAREEKKNLPKLQDHSVAEIWNGSYLKSIRQAMLKGEEHPNCSVCYSTAPRMAENRRIIRNDHWMKYADLEMLRSNTDAQGNLAIGPQALDIRVDNTCNLKCMYCFPTNSTKWLEDKELLNKYENTMVAPPESGWEIKNAHIWEYLQKHGREIREINFLGGEPLASRLHHKVLKSLVEQKAFQVRLSYVTNGTLFRSEVLELWKKFAQVYVTVSIDNTAERLEYTRFPAKWERIRRGMELLQKGRWPGLEMNILWTAHNLNSYYLPETILFLQRHFPHYTFCLGDAVQFPKHMDPSTLPLSLKQKIGERFERTDFGEYREVANAHLVRLMRKDLWKVHGSTFMRYLSDIDRVRGLDWRQTFPEYIPHLES